MTGVASTGTRPLPTRGAVCSTPTSNSADPFSPGCSFDKSVMRAPRIEVSRRYAGGRLSCLILPSEVGVRRQRSRTAASITAANSTTGSQPSSMKRLADR